VNTTLVGSQYAPTIAALPDGSFVIAWADNSRGSLDIRLQVVNAAGGKIGQEMVVNTHTPGSQGSPQVSALPDGRIVVTWTDSSASNDGDTSNSSVRMQIVDPRDGIVVGGAGNDKLYGHDLVNDEISAGDGNDQLFGLRGDDALYGGHGNDTLIGGAGADLLDGGSGTDYASYQSASAGVRADLSSPAANTGEAAGDSYVSLSGLTGSGYADTLLGNSAANTLRGGPGSTRASGTDTLYGRDGNDVLYGYDGNDVLYGGPGNDLLVGGPGSDSLRGESGTDTFLFDSRVGADTLPDFVSGSDKLRISQAGVRVGDGDATLEAAVTRSAPGGFSASAELVVFTSNISGTISTTSAAAKIGSASTAYAVGRTALFAVDNGSSSAVYLFTSANADAVVSASELTLLATLSGTPGTAVGDYLFSS
jgi:Ca2+-binding RTX toxin-like protein